MNVGETLHAISEAGLTLKASKTKDTLKVYPPENITPKLAAAIKEHKARLLKLLEWQRRKLEESDRHGFVARWSRESGWISLHDPTTGEWHDWPAADCFPSIVAEANMRRKKEGAV